MISVARAHIGGSHHLTNPQVAQQWNLRPGFSAVHDVRIVVGNPHLQFMIDGIDDLGF